MVKRLVYTETDIIKYVVGTIELIDGIQVFIPASGAGSPNEPLQGEAPPAQGIVFGTWQNVGGTTVFVPDPELPWSAVGGAPSVGDAGTIQVSDGAGGFQAGSFTDNGTGRLTAGEGLTAELSTGDGAVQVAPDGAISLLGDGVTAKLLQSGAFTVGNPSGDPADAGDVNITGDFKKNGMAIGGGQTIQTIDVTTGASPTDIDLADYADWIVLAVRVTSGGTADTEVLNFIGPDGDLRDTTPGRTINIVFVSQADPSDVIHITQNSGGSFSCIDTLGNDVGTFDTGVFDEVGNNITFGFNGDVIRQYAWNCLYGAWDSPTVIVSRREPLPTGGSYGQLPYSQGEGDSPQWLSSPLFPLRVYLGGAVATLISDWPPASNQWGMALVNNANTPVVGSPVVGGGSSKCVVISDGTDYLVMFIFS